MRTIEIILPIFFGLLSMLPLLVMFLVERRWFYLRKARRCDGIVVDQELREIDGDAYFPVIVVGEGEGSVRFTSHFGSSTKFTLGTKVAVLWDPLTGEAEWYSFSNRFGITIIFGIPFLWFLYLLIQVI